MRRSLRVPLAAAFGFMLVTASLFGAAMMHPNVDTIDDAADYAGFGTAEAASFWSVAEKIASTTGGLSVTSLWDDSSVDEENLTQLDAQETEKELHANAGTQEQNNDNLLTSFGNYLQDTQTIARIEGKNAYIRALNNGSTESEARNAATEAVSSYYATKQKNLIASWNTSASVANSTQNVANNTTGVSSDFVYLPAVAYYDGSPNGEKNYSINLNSSTETLLNGSTVSVAAYDVPESNGEPVTITNGDQQFLANWNAGDSERKYVAVKPPNSNFDTAIFHDFSRFANKWDEIQSQNDAVQSDLDVFINNTYDAYTSGEINNTDLVDPYLGAREYSPDDGFQTWALSSVLSIGVGGPENLTNIGKMVVTDHTVDVQYEGIVLTDENPDGGLTVGQTYNASQLNGTQMVVTSSTTREFTGQFTLENATDSNGTQYTTTESISYKTVNYNTTNTSEYQDLMQQLTQLQQDINERQQEERSGGGGLSGNTGLVAALVAAGAAALIMGRN